MNPLVRLALVHPKQSSVYNLQGIGFQIDQDKEPPVLRRRQRTVLIGRVPAGGARLAIEAPGGHMSLESGLKRRNQLLQLLQRETGQIQHLRGASLDVGES